MEISKLFMSTDVYEVRPRSDKRGVNLISDVLPFGRLWYGEPMRSVSNWIRRCTAADHMTL